MTEIKNNEHKGALLMSTEDKKDTQEVTLAEELTNLFEGAEVTDELKAKIGTVFEAVLTSQVHEKQTELQEAFDTKLEEAKSEAVENLEATVNKYLDYVVAEWVEENKLAIESGIRTEISEGLIVGLKDLLENHYVEIPEGKEDILKTAVDKAVHLETELDESIVKVAELKAQVDEFKRAETLSIQCEGLADTQKEKLESLVAGVEFDNAETFEQKVKTIKESVFTKGEETSEDTKNTLEESADEQDGSKMSAYLRVLNS